MTSNSRQLPWIVKIQSIASTTLSQIGWGFLFVGLIFFWVFGLPAVLEELVQFSFTTTTSQGIVKETKRTDSTINNQFIQSVNYTYLYKGEKYEGHTYTLRNFQIGEKVPVEHRIEYPEISRLAGYTNSKFGYPILFLLIFPLIGLILILLQARKVWNHFQLMRIGIPATAKILSKQPAGQRENGKLVYSLKLQFKDSVDIERTTSINSVFPDSEHEEDIAIFYLEDRPEIANTTSNLPCRPLIKQDGTIEFSKDIVIFKLVPAITIAVHSLIAILYYI